MMHFTRSLSALALAALAAVGCRDASGPAEGAAPAAVPSLAKRADSSSSSGTATFEVSPNNPAKVTLGEHQVSFARNAICDPATSSYGPGTWDAPCAVVGGPVLITATWWTDEEGNPRIDFQPALRFNPVSEVQINIKDRRVATNPEAYRIFWVDAEGLVHDESLADSSVATQIGVNGQLYRRVKHFSGYTVSSGRDLMLETDLAPRAPRPTALRSGHVVATGRAQAARSAIRRAVQRLLGRP